MMMSISLLIPCGVMAGMLDKHVAESTVQPDRIQWSQHRAHYNYNVHKITETRDGETVTIYRYNVVRYDKAPTLDELSKTFERVTLDSRDTLSVTETEKPALCTETKVPDWENPEKIEATSILAEEK